MKLSKLTTLTTLALGAAFIAHAETYAVCFGINKYGTYKGADGNDVSADLMGCVNDANSMKDMAVKTFGAKTENVHVVTDGDANVETFVKEWKWLIASAKPGDQVIFSFSGHGARIADKEAADGQESVIVLAGKSAVPGKFFQKISRVLSDEKGVHSTFVFDSCFSGGMSRDVNSQGILVRRKSLGLLPKFSGIKTNKLSVKDFGLAKKKTLDGEKGSYCFLFAGQKDQPTSDISGANMEAHGLFTLLLLGSIEENPAVAVNQLIPSMQNVLDRINTKFAEAKKDMHFDQKPDFEASSEDRAGKGIILK